MEAMECINTSLNSLLSFRTVYEENEPHFFISLFFFFGFNYTLMDTGPIILCLLALSCVCMQLKYNDYLVCQDSRDETQPCSDMSYTYLGEFTYPIASSLSLAATILYVLIHSSMWRKLN